MNKLKVMTVVGTRPEIIKLSRIIPKLDRFFDHVLVNTSQNFDYELNKIFFKDLNIRKPDVELKTQSESAAKTIAKVIDETDTLIKKHRPDAFLILGDTKAMKSKNNLKINVIIYFLKY